MRILTVVGARPQFIKSGPVSRAFDSKGVDECVVHTGQHYDPNMSDVFFHSLGLRRPDFQLNVGSGTHATQTGAMLSEIEAILLDVRPDALLVYGDTNSTLAGALAAAKLHTPVVHVEAGLRSFNRTMPEEINRVVTDHLSDLLFCPTTTAVDHLHSEGITRGVYMVGDVMKDALDYWQARRDEIGTSSDACDFELGEYFLATVHRAENVDIPARLDGIVDALGRLNLPVVLPLHPRTRKALLDRNKSLPEQVVAIDPVGYLEMLDYQSGARAVLTDSGGVQKEAYMLGVRCITLRDETEWVETVASGWNSLVGADPDAIVRAAAAAAPRGDRPNLFGDGHASDRIADTVISSLS